MSEIVNKFLLAGDKFVSVVLVNLLMKTKKNSKI